MFPKQENNGRDDVGKCDLVVLDMLAKPFNVEFGHYKECQTRIDALVQHAG